MHKLFRTVKIARQTLEQRLHRRGWVHGIVPAFCLLQHHPIMEVKHHTTDCITGWTWCYQSIDADKAVGET